MQRGHVVAIILVPLAVLVLEDIDAQQAVDIHLVEGAERLDRQVDEGGQITVGIGANVHSRIVNRLALPGSDRWLALRVTRIDEVGPNLGLHVVQSVLHSGGVDLAHAGANG